MNTDKDRLFAFNCTEPIQAKKRTGRYDARRQLWIGNNEGPIAGFTDPQPATEWYETIEYEVITASNPFDESDTNYETMEVPHTDWDNGDWNNC